MKTNQTEGGNYETSMVSGFVNRGVLFHQHNVCRRRGGGEGGFQQKMRQLSRSRRRRQGFDRKGAEDRVSPSRLKRSTGKERCRTDKDDSRGRRKDEAR